MKWLETNRMLMNHRKELAGDEKLQKGGKEINSFFSYCVYRFWGLRVSLETETTEETSDDAHDRPKDAKYQVASSNV